ncbi:HutD family protein [Cypionkella sp.]|uniref:HutD/Ves family protein n=1 Tax=Cypionkella sp. TaxID=2811411 RepID=UPI002720E0B1|nr:HutD family protein [Cypionkella sp.]MDO8985139.1 HutD family protein [Cypionkella sp.]MDP2047304.1 HutD family protein [Cypionkella sp.]
MIRHLTPADYKTMPWANGKGVTVEMLKDEENGQFLWRLSRASVVENGDFSLFPGIERNLTVITGPGFDLISDGLHLPAKPLIPVAFPGDIPIFAAAVTAPSDDFNVMTARHLPRPDVAVITGFAQLRGGDMLAIFALTEATVNGRAIGPYDMILTDQPAILAGQMIAVRLFR